MSNIPDDVKQKVTDKVRSAYMNRPEREKFIEGTEFGYSLSLTKIQELEKENERLNHIINSLQHTISLMQNPF